MSSAHWRHLQVPAAAVAAVSAVVSVAAARCLQRWRAGWRAGWAAPPDTHASVVMMATAAAAAVVKKSQTAAVTKAQASMMDQTPAAAAAAAAEMTGVARAAQLCHHRCCMCRHQCRALPCKTPGRCAPQPTAMMRAAVTTAAATTATMLCHSVATTAAATPAASAAARRTLLALVAPMQQLLTRSWLPLRWRRRLSLPQHHRRISAGHQQQQQQQQQVAQHRPALPLWMWTSTWSGAWWHHTPHRGGCLALPATLQDCLALSCPMNSLKSSDLAVHDVHRACSGHKLPLASVTASMARLRASAWLPGGLAPNERLLWGFNCLCVIRKSGILRT